MLAQRKPLTLVPTPPDLGIHPTLIDNDSHSKSTTPTSNEFLFNRLHHRKNISTVSVPHYSTPPSPLLPSPRSPFLQHNRRRTHGGDISPAALLNVEEKIALLEAANERLKIELEETRQALLIEQEEKASRSAASATNPEDSSEHSELSYERNLRVEILESLKKVRTQNTLLSRSVREHKEQCESLSSILSEERAQRSSAEEEISRLMQANFALSEHNKLLMARDHVPQQDGQPVLDVTDVDGVSSTSEDSLRSQLNTVSDDLHIAKLQLAAAEEKNAELSEHVAFIQQQMTQCLDTSAEALEVERDLRNEFMGRMNVAETENKMLHAKLQALQRVPQPIVTPRRIHRCVPVQERIANRLSSMRRTRRMITNLTIHQNELRRLRSAVPDTLSSHPPMPPSLDKLFRDIPSSVSTPVLSAPSSADTSPSISTALVSAKLPALPLLSQSTQPIPLHTRRSSVLLSATLSHKTSYLSSTLKAKSTCSMSTTGWTDSLINEDRNNDTVSFPILMRKAPIQHAATILADIVTQDSGWEIIDRHIPEEI